MWATLILFFKRMSAKSKLKREQAKLERHSTSLDGSKPENTKTKKLKKEIKILNVSITVSLAGAIAIIIVALLMLSYITVMVGSLSGFGILSRQQERIAEEEAKDGWVWDEKEEDYIPPEIKLCECGCMADYDYSTGNPGGGSSTGSSGSGPYVDVPNDENKYGTLMTYMGYHKITGASNQLTLKKDAKANKRYSISKPENYAMIDGRILVALTPNIGGKLKVKIGDYVDVTFESKDGTTKVYKCIMGDQKAIGSPKEPDITVWGHNYGRATVEIIYHDGSNVKNYGNNPWGKGRTSRITLVGNYYKSNGQTGNSGSTGNGGNTVPGEPSAPPVCKCTDKNCCNQIVVPPATGPIKFSSDINKVPLFTDRTKGVKESSCFRRLPKIVEWTSNGIKRNGIAMNQNGGGDWNYKTAGFISPGSSCMVYAYAQAMSYLTGTMVTVPTADKIGIDTGKIIVGTGSSDGGGTSKFAAKFGAYGEHFTGTVTTTKTRSLLEQLREPLAAGNTAVVFRGKYNAATGASLETHYITIVDYDMTTQKFIVLNPAGGKLKAYTIDTFLKGTIRSIQIYTTDQSVLSRVN